MKKIILILIAVFGWNFCIAQSPQIPIPIPIKAGTIKVKKGRSVEIVPKAFVDTDQCQLSISMVSNDSYTLYVYDGNGGVVYQGLVVTDGGRHAYFLPELDADLYTISIESQSTTYEGEFYAN